MKLRRGGRVNGTDYKISSGKTLVNGTNYDIKFEFDYSDMFSNMTKINTAGRANSSNDYIYIPGTTSTDGTPCYFLCNKYNYMSVIYAPSADNGARINIFSTDDSDTPWAGWYTRSNVYTGWYLGSESGWETMQSGTLVQCNFTDIGEVQQFFSDYAMISRSDAKHISGNSIVFAELDSPQEGDIVFLFYSTRYAISVYKNGEWSVLNYYGTGSDTAYRGFVYGTGSRGTGLYMDNIDTYLYGGALFVFRK